MSALDADTIMSACQRLHDRGDRVSLRSVRAELGRGSFSTISEAVTAWRSNARPDAHVSTPEMDALESLAPGALARLRQALREEMNREVAQARQEVAELQASLTETLEVVGDLEERSQILADQERIHDSLRENIRATAPAVVEPLVEKLNRHEGAFAVLVQQVRDHIAQSTFKHSETNQTIQQIRDIHHAGIAALKDTSAANSAANAREHGVLSDLLQALVAAQAKGNATVEALTDAVIEQGRGLASLGKSQAQHGMHLKRLESAVRALARRP
ncbi:MAG: DNA-binding protein [Planctomycetota bacterium]|nr:DNA-binding protein [Planctomycetota bacterium]